MEERIKARIAELKLEVDRIVAPYAAVIGELEKLLVGDEAVEEATAPAKE